MQLFSPTATEEISRSPPAPPAPEWLSDKTAKLVSHKMFVHKNYVNF